MSDLEKYQSPVIEQRLANFETPPESESQSTSNLIMGIMRRWYIVLAVFFIMCAVGITAIWFSVTPLYSVTGAIRIESSSPHPTDTDDKGTIPNYPKYMNTQAEIITSSRIVQNVADALKDKNLVFFENKASGIVMKIKQRLKNTKAKPEPASMLKQAILNGVIRAAADRNTELIKITMKSANAKEAKTIVDAFIDAYKADRIRSSSEGEFLTISNLEDKAGILADSLKKQREKIDALGEKYGTKSSVTLDKHQEIKLGRMEMLLSKITEWEGRRIDLETQLEKLKKRLESSNADKEEQLTEQEKLAAEAEIALDQNDLTLNEYIDNDLRLINLIANLVQSEQDLFKAGQIYTKENPEYKNIKATKEMWEERVEERKAKLVRTWNAFKAEKIAKVEEGKQLIAEKQLTDLQEELGLASALEQRFKNMFDEVELETHDVGIRQMEIENLQFQLRLDQEIYDTIRRRISVLDVGRSRPERISVAYYAESGPIRDKRIKYTMALMFGSMACGMMLAFLRDKVDLRLRTPDDVVKRIGIRIIGTTTSSDTIKRSFLPKQLAGDYQTIRANLRLFNGDTESKILVIASPCMREGKTTFAINLATSMSKSGKKVLLIDGDLRKPDIAYLLNLPRGSRGLQDLLFGRKKYNQVVCSIPATGLDVLAADFRNRDDACELLALPGARERIKTISQAYDHVIIDTPPVLAFPDALVWAKMADAVILTSFARQTTAPDLREATEKLAQINANVLGAVLSNVSADNSYYRYGHNYYVQNARSRKNAKQAAAKLLLPAEPKS
ncbi:MAG: polysaccharide biosynthesis tyrosine autokinase [Planctomycetota bacterium]|jgi:capsular exopolysaccharide synthesis family protein